MPGPFLGRHVGGSGVSFSDCELLGQTFLAVISEIEAAAAKLSDQIAELDSRERVAERVVLSSNNHQSSAFGERAPHHNRDGHVLVSRDARFGSGSSGFVPVSLFELDAERNFNRRVVLVAICNDVAANFPLVVTFLDVAERHPRVNKLALLAEQFSDHFLRSLGPFENPFPGFRVPASAFLSEDFVIAVTERRADGDFVEGDDDTDLGFHGGFLWFRVLFGFDRMPLCKHLADGNQRVLGLIRIWRFARSPPFEETLYVCGVVADYARSYPRGP